jgi:hypothetical protein
MGHLLARRGLEARPQTRTVKEARAKVAATMTAVRETRAEELDAWT